MNWCLRMLPRVPFSGELTRDCECTRDCVYDQKQLRGVGIGVGLHSAKYAKKLLPGESLPQGVQAITRGCESVREHKKIERELINSVPTTLGI